MKQLTATGTGQTVDEAIENALKELNVAKEKVEVSIIDEGKKGIFGVFGSRPAIVKLKVNINPMEEAKTYLENVIAQMGVTADVEAVENGKELTLNISGADIAKLIGKRGQTLNALQYLVQIVANKYSNDYITVIVDAENYRMRRRETLENLATRLAAKAKKTKTKVVLEPMPSFERKIIHSVLSEVEGVSTVSDGVEPNRHIIIIPE
ncbi:RNA-binding cell elongation regulator Jag/EloR [Calidifontibacillus erzurumensis]|uniref:RNA-binding protein KhpB n=1 Tax=Calidifontibacillus erzurumensis TaxID=2741433 RepID=A0A8J8KC82_9BACI|nr:RNA-binding cell elongation regulator Jag/EloR [Calidifontibacillus erzurumensis]NSL52357.1 protein jag [Calidifontibacillus erzurumensis]